MIGEPYGRIGFLPLFLLSGLAACGGSDDTVAATEPTTVDVAAASVESVTRTISTVATLDSEADATIRAEVEGRITRIAAGEGAIVDEGESLLQIDSRRFQLALADAQARLKQAEAQFANDSIRLARTSTLLDAGAVDRQTVDDLSTALVRDRTLVEGARVAAEMAQLNFDLSRVLAPFRGTFLDRKVDLGDHVRVGDPIGRLVDLTTLRVTFRVPEPDAIKITRGDVVRIQVKSLATLPEFPGTIYYISPAVDPATRTVEMKARVPHAQGLLRPGMSSAVELVTSSLDSVPVVPEVAVRTEAGSQFVYVASGGRAHRVPVETGARPSPGRISVRGGVSGGDSVIVGGFQKIAEGSRVMIRDTMEVSGRTSGSPGNGGA